MQDWKKALVVFGGAFLIYLLLSKPKSVSSKSKVEDRKPIDVPTMNPNDAKGNKLASDGYIALSAYVSAYNNGESQSALDELNREFAKELKVRVYRRASDKKLVVTDLKGNTILVNNG